MPPCPWTIAFGRPVVPDENSTNSGWSKATGSKRERPGLGEQLVPGERVRNCVVAVGDVHDVAQRGEGGADRRHLFAAVDRAVAEAVPADRQQHRGLELREAVDDAARAELGRAARPDRSEARRRRERDQRLGDVRQVGDHAVARADAEPHEAGPCARHLLAELRERELGRLARLRVRDDRDLVRRPRRRPSRCSAKFSRAPGNQVAPGIASEPRTVLYGAWAFTSKNSQIDDQNAGEVVDRPAPELVVVREREPALALEPGEVAPDLGRLPDVRRRRPQTTRQSAPTCAPC